ncbi:MAG: hypothetical protein K9H26_17455 [Prolixibacteraceae bacterium]|nr:hypothetical protein [Prolixibacteraceae bacterium]
MKTKLLAILISQFISLACFPQMLVRENVVWSTVLFEGPTGIPYNTTYKKFEGDTLINTNSYKKVYISWSENHPNWSFWNRYIREDNGKVYVWNIQSRKDILYYDYSLSEGDSFYIYWQDPIDDFPLIVDSIRTISINGIGYKHWFLSSIEYSEVWIEKIGSLYGVLIPIGSTIAGGGYSLLCVSENGELIYQNEKYNTCFMKSNDVPLLEKKPTLIEVFSNSEGQVFIQSVKEHSGDFYMYTTDGKQILKRPLTAPETTLCAPGTGLFLYRFVSKEGGVQSGKIVVK